MTTNNELSYNDFKIWKLVKRNCITLRIYVFLCVDNSIYSIFLKKKKLFNLSLLSGKKIPKVVIVHTMIIEILKTRCFKNTA